MTKRARRPAEQTFSEIVNEVPIPTGGCPVTSPDPIGDRCWTDGSGIEWRLRGQAGRDLGRHKIEKLLRDPAVRVVLFYDEPQEVPIAERESFWAQARPYYLELVDRDATSDNTFYDFAEFVDDAHHHMLVVRMSC